MAYPFGKLISNPTDGIINIKMAEFKEATIYNLSGKKIMRSIDNRIDISSLSCMSSNKSGLSHLQLDTSLY